MIMAAQKLGAGGGAAGTLSMLKMRNLFISSIASNTSQYDDPIQNHLHSQATVSGGDLNRKPAEEDMLGASAKETLAIMIVLCYEAMQHITRGSYCDITCGVQCGLWIHLVEPHCGV